MDAIPTFEIEFPCSGPAFDRVMKTVRLMTEDMDEDCFRLEPLVRAHGHLLEPWHADADAPDGYAYRVHLDPLAAPEVIQVRDELLLQLVAYGVAVRETTTVH
jgi:hypothetical protein